MCLQYGGVHCKHMQEAEQVHTCYTFKLMQTPTRAEEKMMIKRSTALCTFDALKQR